MNITAEDFITIIGTKEAELFALRRRVAELEQALRQVATTTIPSEGQES